MSKNALRLKRLSRFLLADASEEDRDFLVGDFCGNVGTLLAVTSARRLPPLLCPLAPLFTEAASSIARPLAPLSPLLTEAELEGNF